MKRRSWVAILACVSALVGVAAASCSSPKSDGEACDTSSDCKSKTCVSGQCGGSSCTCAEGVCKDAPECQSGWACVREGTGAESAFPVCRRLCADGGACATNEHCDTDDVCHIGTSPVDVTFAGEPRVHACEAFLDCTWNVTVSGGSGAVDHYTWVFDDGDAGVQTNAPTVTHKYAPGAHTTSVSAVDKNGTEGHASTDDDICVDGQELQCVAGAINCCQGSCAPEGGCF